MPTIACDTCGAQVTKSPSRVRATNFCSRACRDRHLRSRLTISCNTCGAEFERVPSQVSASNYCSMACKATGMRQEEIATTYRMVNRPGHPLATASGVIPEHRLLLYEAIGPGAHPCHYCGDTVTWMPGMSTRKGALTVDHVDGDPLNNDLANLVPCCQACNNAKSISRVRDDEVFIERQGVRRRAVECICERCGGRFLATRYEVNRGRRFCSRSCAGIGV